MKRLLCVLFVASVVVAAGCGGGSKTPTAPTPAPTPPAAPPPAPTSLPAPTTATLTGTALSASGSRISGATVSISSGPNSGMSTTTNSNGDYRFDTLRVGATSLVARALGYQDGNLSINIADTSVLNFTLQAVVDPFTGTWNGGVETLSCSADGILTVKDFCTRFPKLSDFTTPSITTIRLVLRQSGNTVRGEVSFSGAWRVDVTGTIAGGTLTLAGTGNVSQQGLELTFALGSWDTELSGATSMTGDFVFRGAI